MDRAQRDAERDPEAAIKGSPAHERMLRLHERAGGHVHGVIELGAMKMCTSCPQRWELAGTRGNYYWEPLDV